MTGPSPFFSMIVATRNRPDLLPVALRSVQAQTYDDYKCIIVDDGSDEPVRVQNSALLASLGEVRHPARLRQKGRTHARQHDPKNPRWDWVPAFVFDLFPHRWDDPDIFPFLHLYDGPYLQAVRDDPEEFVRDGFRLCKLLAQRQCSGTRA